MNRFVFVFLFLFSAISSPVFSEAYPPEFADFFEEHHKKIEVVIAGAPRGVLVDGVVTYESFRLGAGQGALDKYMKDLNLKEYAIDEILTQLTIGVKIPSSCIGNIESCVPAKATGGAEYVFDYDSQTVTVFIDGTMLNHHSQDDYHPSVRRSNALINWLDLYTYFDEEGGSSFSWGNETIVGLPQGYLSVETQYQYPYDGFKLYRALYDFEEDDTRVLLGYQGSTTVRFNSSDFLYSGANYAGFGYSVGRSQNLLKGKAKQRNRVYFFAPQTAQLEVYKDGRLLFNKVVSQGQQSIGYDEIPSGAYDLTLKLKQGSKVIYQERRMVVNTSQFSLLPVERWDYRLDVGMLKDLAVDDPTYLNQVSDRNRIYARLSGAFRPIESLLFSSGLTTAKDDSSLNIGGIWVPNKFFKAEYSMSLFNSGALSQLGQVTLGSLYSSYRYVDSSEEGSSFTDLLYGPMSSRDWTVGLYGEVLGGNGYLSYSNYQRRRINTLRTSFRQSESESNNISMSWSKDIFGGRLGISANYSLQEDQKGVWGTTLSWSMPLGDKVSASTEFNLDQRGLAYNRTSITQKGDLEHGSFSSTLGANFVRNNDFYVDGSVDFYGNRETFGYRAYAYASQNGQHSLSGGISGTQIVSEHGIELTHQKGHAFIGMKPEGTVRSDLQGTVNYNLHQDGQFTYQDKVELGRLMLIKVNDYTEVAVELDPNSTTLDIEDAQFEHFVMPGYYYQLNSQVAPLESQVFLLNDVFGGDALTASCYGMSCKNTEVLSGDGVIRVNYKKGGVFKLISKGRRCVYDRKALGQAYIQAYCLPGIEERNNGLSNKNLDLISLPGKDYSLKYIGQYQSTPSSNSLLLQLQDLGLFPVLVNVGDSVYVYIRHIEKYSTGQNELLQGLDVYAVIDDFDAEQLFTMR